jgi:hypothetical protein
MRFGTWTVRRPYRAGSPMTVANELSKYKLQLVGVQEVRWESGDSKPVSECTFFHGKGDSNNELGIVFHLCKRI